MAKVVIGRTGGRTYYYKTDWSVSRQRQARREYERAKGRLRVEAARRKETAYERQKLRKRELMEQRHARETRHLDPVEYKTTQATSQEEGITFEQAVRREKQRLQAKYPGQDEYISEENIRKKLLRKERTVPVEEYPYFTGTPPSQVMRERKGKIIADIKQQRAADTGVYGTSLGPMGGSGMSFVRALHARDAVEYGGAMGGQLTSESAQRLGFERIFARQEAKAGQPTIRFTQKVEKKWYVGDKEFESFGAADRYIRTQESKYWFKKKPTPQPVPDAGFITPESRGATYLGGVGAPDPKVKQKPMQMGLLPRLSEEQMVAIGRPLLLESHRLGPITVDFGKPFRTIKQESDVRGKAKYQRERIQQLSAHGARQVQGLKPHEKITVTDEKGKEKTMSVMDYKIMLHKQKKEELEKIETWEKESIGKVKSGKKVEMLVTGGLISVALVAGGMGAGAGATMSGKLYGATKLIGTTTVLDKTGAYKAVDKTVEDMIKGGVVARQIAAHKMTGKTAGEALVRGLQEEIPDVGYQKKPWYSTEKMVALGGKALLTGAAYKGVSKVSDPVVMHAGKQIAVSKVDYGSGFKKFIKPEKTMKVKGTGRVSMSAAQEAPIPYGSPLKLKTIVSPDKKFAQTVGETKTIMRYKSFGYDYKIPTTTQMQYSVGRITPTTYKIMGQTTVKSPMAKSAATEITRGKLTAYPKTNLYKYTGGRAQYQGKQIIQEGFDDIMSYGRPYGKYYSRFPRSEIIQSIPKGHTLPTLKSSIRGYIKGTGTKITPRIGQYKETGLLRSIKPERTTGYPQARYTSKYYDQFVRQEYKRPSIIDEKLGVRINPQVEYTGKYIKSLKVPSKKGRTPLGDIYKSTKTKTIKSGDYSLQQRMVDIGAAKDLAEASRIVTQKSRVGLSASQIRSVKTPRMYHASPEIRMEYGRTQTPTEMKIPDVAKIPDSSQIYQQRYAPQHIYKIRPETRQYTPQRVHTKITPMQIQDPRQKYGITQKIITTQKQKQITAQVQKIGFGDITVPGYSFKTQTPPPIIPPFGGFLWPTGGYQPFIPHKPKRYRQKWTPTHIPKGLEAIGFAFPGLFKKKKKRRRKK